MIRLLYVDDDTDTCTIISSFCERIGMFSVKILNSGETALEWLSASSADVIVSDYCMPGGMDGMMLLRKLHAHGNMTPFIFFSATESPEIKKEAYREGAFSFISKTSTGKIPLYQLVRTICWAFNRTLPEPVEKSPHLKKHDA